MAGIYVHVPFCKAKCAYCDFYSVGGERFKQPYSEAVAKEWHARRPELGAEEIRTIYFGGGTPSSLSPDLLAGLAGLFPLDRVEEFTIEVNPEDVSPEAVTRWRAMGVNRVSMGVQSLVDAELKAVGRRHNAAEAIAAVACLQDAGIDNISCDLIYGLPGQDADSWRYSLDSLLGLGIKHLSAYSLSFEEGTRLSAWLKEGRISPVSDDLACSMYEELCIKTSAAGFEHYEISNFALPGFESKHNASYWDARTPYLGLGPGAHSLDCNGVRRFVPPGLSRYVAHPEQAAQIDEESEVDRLNDLLFVGLRTAVGLDLARLPLIQRNQLLRDAKWYIEREMLTINENRIKIPEKHWLVSDSIIRDLLFD